MDGVREAGSLPKYPAALRLRIGLRRRRPTVLIP